MLKTKDGRVIDLKVLSYDDLTNEIAVVDPIFAEILRKLSKGNEKAQFYKVRYKFGDKIIGNENYYLPLVDGGGIAFDDPQLTDELKSSLSYDSNTEDALAIVISKSSEFYIPLTDRILPNAIIKPGNMFGIPRAINNIIETKVSSEPATIRSLNAGATSLFMLHKISNNIYHSKLQRKYNIKTTVPQSLNEHGQIFIDIANSSNAAWRSELIYFPREWINKLKTMEYATAVVHLMHKHHTSYNIWHNSRIIWNAAFGEIDYKYDFANNSQQYSLGTTKHLFMLAANSAIGFRPSTDEEMAPIKLLQKAYETGYYTPENGNRKYSLTIMEPTTFTAHDSNSVYYSINHSTFEQAKNETAQSKSNINILQEIVRINELYRRDILMDKHLIKSLYNVASKTEFTFFHNNPIDYKEIASASLIAESDSRFSKGQTGEFPKDSPFFKGCIKVSSKN